jgi:hypothetical protein
MKKLDAKKQALLATTLDNLGVEKMLTKKHVQYLRKNNLNMRTLAEFIAANNSKLLKRKDNFNLCFSVEGRSWTNLRNFLISNGFTVKDWVMLCPKKKMAWGETYDLSALSREQVEQLTLDSIVQASYSTVGYYHYYEDESMRGCLNSPIDRKILATVLKIDPSSEEYRTRRLSVKEFLVLFDPQKIETTFIFSGYRTSRHSSMVGLQKVLRRLGFTEKDGEFMKVVFGGKTKQYHINRLVNEKKFSESEARTAVEWGLKAGWITASDY